MKNLLKKFVVIYVVLTLCAGICGCSKADKDYGVSDETQVPSEPVKTVVDPEYVYPNIMSDDAVMPKFIDISLYDEENYADIYLGDKFELNAVYDGVNIKLPITYREIKKLGWQLAENGEYDVNSLILAGKTIKAELKNKNGKEITAYFYNTEDSSVRLKKCNIVKLKIEENSFYEADEADEHGAFNINGITNDMVMTDIINIMGAPSHFYHEGDNEYYLDYFVSKDDRRNGITVYVDIDDDSITAIEFSMYK